LGNQRLGSLPGEVGKAAVRGKGVILGDGHPISSCTWVQAFSLPVWFLGGCRPPTMFYHFAGTCVFGKQSPGSLHCGPYAGHSFFRRYRANLPSPLERVISLPLVYSTHVPVSVYGTGAILSKSMSFSWKKWREKEFVVPPAKVANFFRFICSSLRTNKITVKEYKPSFHRLRLSASP